MRRRLQRGKLGFTLVEVLVSTAILGILLSVLLMMVAQSNLLLRQAHRKSSVLKQGQTVGAVLKDWLSSATLASTDEYFDADTGTFFPSMATPHGFSARSYAIASFVCGPSNSVMGVESQRYPGDCLVWASPRPDADSGLSRVLNGRICLVVYGNDPERPGTASYRYRLVVLQDAPATFRQLLESGDTSWCRKVFDASINSDNPDQIQVVADNVVALWIEPLDEDHSPAIEGSVYDTWAWRKSTQSGNSDAERSFNRLPYALRVGVVTIPESVAGRLAAVHGSNPPLGLLPQPLAGSEYWEVALQDYEEGFDTPCELKLYTTVVRLPEE